MKIRRSIDSHQLKRLRGEVENRLTFPIKSPDDYARLSDLLKEEGCGSVSATTLKRIWGYISDTGSDYRPNAYTVTALCRLIGFKDLEEFLDSDSPIQSRQYSGSFIESRNLPEGAEVEIQWRPKPHLPVEAYERDPIFGGQRRELFYPPRRRHRRMSVFHSASPPILPNLPRAAAAYHIRCRIGKRNHLQSDRK